MEKLNQGLKGFQGIFNFHFLIFNSNIILSILLILDVFSDSTESRSIGVFMVAFGSKLNLKLTGKILFKILNPNSKLNFKHSDLYSFYGVLEYWSF